MPISFRLSELEVQVGRFVYAMHSKSATKQMVFKPVYPRLMRVTVREGTHTLRKYPLQNMPRPRQPNLSRPGGMPIMKAGIGSRRREQG